MDEFSILEKLKADIEREQKSAEQPAPLDPAHFSAYVKNPADVSEEDLYQIADIIDGKYNIKPRSGTVNLAMPATVDRLMNSLAIIYICDDGIPVAAATLIDPTIKSFQGYAPLTLYSLHSGQNLDGRLQQEFFSISDEYTNIGLGRELKAQIKKLGTPTFTVSDVDDDETNEGLIRNGYNCVATMNIDSNDVPLFLWLD